MWRFWEKEKQKFGIEDRRCWSKCKSKNIVIVVNVVVALIMMMEVMMMTRKYIF